MSDHVVHVALSVLITLVAALLWVAHRRIDKLEGRDDD